MWWIINIVGLLLSWRYTDIESGSAFENTICPVLTGVFLVGLLIKAVFALGSKSGRGDSGGDGGSGFFGGFGGDCDGNSSGDGGGSCGGDSGGC